MCTHVVMQPIFVRLNNGLNFVPCEQGFTHNKPIRHKQLTFQCGDKNSSVFWNDIQDIFNHNQLAAFGTVTKYSIHTVNKIK